MWTDLMAASALVLVFEGALPFLSPVGYRQAMARVLAFDDIHLRRLGLLSMVAGLVVLYCVR